MILDDLKEFIIKNNISSQEQIKYDYDSSNGENTTLLWLYNSVASDLANKSSINITFKNKDLETARNSCFSLYNLLFPIDCFQKAIKINGKTMHSKLNRGPLYQQKDSSDRHQYLLDITISHNR